MESTRSVECNQSEGGYTLTRDNQAKRVGKLACQRASADCSASVPSKTEHSTKCRRANGGRARSIPYRRYATDYIHDYVVIPCQSFGLDRKKTVRKRSFFLAPPALLKPLYPQKHFFNRRRYLNYFLTPIDISGWISQKFSAKLRLMSS